jgi:hypothetical protein
MINTPFFCQHILYGDHAITDLIYRQAEFLLFPPLYLETSMHLQDTPRAALAREQ